MVAQPPFGLSRVSRGDFCDRPQAPLWPDLDRKRNTGTFGRKATTKTKTKRKVVVRARSHGTIVTGSRSVDRYHRQLGILPRNDRATKNSRSFLGRRAEFLYDATTVLDFSIFFQLRISSKFSVFRQMKNYHFYLY